jgi:hypothetical protein
MSINPLAVSFERNYARLHPSAMNAIGSEPMNFKPVTSPLRHQTHKKCMAPKVATKPAAKCGKKPKTDGKKKINTRKRSDVGFPDCKTYTGDYKDINGAGYCDSCDTYVDKNLWDRYWEHICTIGLKSLECTRN